MSHHIDQNHSGTVHHVILNTGVSAQSANVLSLSCVLLPSKFRDLQQAVHVAMQFHSIRDAGSAEVVANHLFAEPRLVTGIS